MAIRISQRQMYTSFLGNMNGSLAALMESNIQSGSQKKVNRPSDDPYGMAQIMASNRHLDNIAMYKDNVSMARGWLNTADSTLGSVHTQLMSLRDKLLQVSSDSYTEEQRKIDAQEAREIFGQLLLLSNTTYNGRYIFSGHKTENKAFDETLSVTSNYEDFSDLQYVVKGGSAKSIVVHFTNDSDLKDTSVVKPTFEYSDDGGENWKTGTWVDGNPPTMQCGGVSVDIIFGSKASYPAKAVDKNDPNETDNGTWMYIKPTAVYNGDTKDATVVQGYVPSGSTAVTGSVEGVFTRDVAVRIDSYSAGKVVYSYSMDDGKTWVSNNANDTVPMSLPVPGGFLNLTAKPDPGHQFVIKPHRADVTLTIGKDTDVTINNVGKDVFGGIYEAPFSTIGAQPVGSYESNMFEVVGDAIAYLETNSPEGVADCLAALTKVMEHVVTQRTSVGARINRLDTMTEQLDSLKIDESDRLSSLEDVDVSELLTRLAQQQLAYNSVLKSSSMIMQMSLMNFL